jgi:hypothetical protein
MNKKLFKDAEIKAMQENGKLRAERCLAKIQQDLIDFNCGLLPKITLIGERQVSEFMVIAKPMPTTPKGN